MGLKCIDDGKDAIVTKGDTAMVYRVRQRGFVVALLRFLGIAVVLGFVLILGRFWLSMHLDQQDRADSRKASSQSAGAESMAVITAAAQASQAYIARHGSFAPDWKSMGFDASLGELSGVQLD
jgi:hypothetical protein